MFKRQKWYGRPGKSFNIASQFGRLPLGVQLFAVTAGFFLLAVGGIILTREAGRIAWIWLPNAALLALVLEARLPRQIKLMAAGVAGNLLANLSVGDTPVNAIVLSSFNTMEILISIVFLTRLCPNTDLGRPDHLMKFALIAGGIAPAVVGLVASTYLHFAFATPFWSVFLNWYGADALGMLLVAPFLLAGIPNTQKTIEKESLTKPATFGVFLLCLAVTTAVFFQSSYPFLFLVMLPLALTAFTTGVLGTALTTLAISILAIGFTIAGSGPFALMQADLNIKVLVLQIFLVSCVVFSLSIAAVLTQQRLLKEELLSLKKEAEQANEAKSEFLATVNHELRTPLTSIRGAIGLLGNGAGGELPEKARKLLSITQMNCDRLLMLVNDVLEMEKIESGKFTLSLKPEVVRQGLENIYFSNLSYLPQKQISIVLIDRAPKASLMIDEARFEQAITNLVSNAIKFSPEQSVVRLEAGYDGGSYRIAVIDEGPGIPVDFRQKVFQKFEQADVGSMRSVTGTGLGLSITKALVEQMNGSIAFQADANGGTEFFIELPTVRSGAMDRPRPKLVVLISDQAKAGEISSLAIEAGWYADLAATSTGFERLLQLEAYEAVVIGASFEEDGLIDQIQFHAASTGKHLTIVKAVEARQFLLREEQSHTPAVIRQSA
ncbi:ATP-binding protein [Roseibium aggregatum]|uniref:sensor histidine kinase n=1 Tax=Roseibium aggregatum TaxID=187304 RepID=UPI003A97595B